MTSLSIEIFFSYAHEDGNLRQKLDDHLSLVWRRGIARQWHDRKIQPGDNFTEAIDGHLNSAEIILLLVSASFLASEYCYGIEMTRALERHANGEARVIPVIIKDVDWRDAPFSELQCLPSNGKAVTLWRNEDQALANVARGIRDVVDRVLAAKNRRPGEPLTPVLAPRRRWRWVATAAVALALVIAGVHYRTRWRASPPPQTAAALPATPAAPMTAEQIRNAKLAFAAGAFIAVAGQSSNSTAAPMFDRALSDLRVSDDRVRELDVRYGLIEAAARDGTLRYDAFETAKAILLGQVGEQLKQLHGPPSAATAVFGHDTAALRLLLRHWADAAEEGDVLATARDRVASLRNSVNHVAVPGALAERIHALRAGDLAVESYRREAERLLDETVRYFDMPAP